MNRREFIVSSVAATAVTAATLESCSTRKVEASGDAALGEIPTDQMTYRQGTHGEQVSLLGYGCMRWPTLPDSQSLPNGNDIDQEQVNRLVDYAMEHGINYYDTSPVYCKGFSEQATGIALARHPRNSYFIATKASNFDPSMWPFQESVKMYHRSLEYLQTDYLDFYLLHSIGGGGMDNLRGRYLDNGFLEFLLKEREAGRIRNLGFSYHGDIECFDYLLAHNDYYRWDFVQIQLNYVDWRNAKTINPRNTNADYLLGELKKRNIPAVIMEPLLGGRLASLPAHATAMLKQHEPQRSIASWAFRFAGQDPATLTVLSGMTYMEHLQDNLRTYAPFKPLNQEELDMLEQIAHEYATFPLIPCTQCQYCMPCPYGIDIPSNFTHYNKCLNEGLIQDNTQANDYKQLRRKYLMSYAKQIERERQADHCIACGQCLEHCPQHINIPAQLQRIDKFVENLRIN